MKSSNSNMDQGLREEVLISIVVPTYNGAHFLKDFSLPSVLAQTYKNWELIIVDDGSSDNTKGIIDEFRKKMDGITYIKNPKNLGLAATYNTGIKAAKGSLIAFLEQDDIWLPEKLSQQLKAMQSNKHCVCCTSRCWLLDAQRMKIFGVAWAAFSGLMIYKYVFNEIGPFDERVELFGMQDGDLKAMLDLAYAQCNPAYYLKIDKPLIIFVRSEGSLSSRRNGGVQKFIERYTSICAKYDKLEFNNNADIRFLLNFWYTHLGFNLLLAGDRKRGRAAAQRAIHLKKNRSAKLVYFLSYFPTSIARTAYTFIEIGTKKLGAFRIGSEKGNYKKEYLGAMSFIRSIKAHR